MKSDVIAKVVRLAARLALIGVGLAAALNLGSCVEWGTNSQGQLQSIGLPGLPVWQSQTLTDQNRQASEGILAASPGTELDPKAANLPSSPSQADWLVEVNRWRVAAGVSLVGENVELSTAAGEHARYLVKRGPSTPDEFLAYEIGIDGSAHSENSDSPYFTHEGREAAHFGDVAWERDPLADVQGLVVAPFHRVSILAPWMRVGGYGSYGAWPMRASTLVLRGSTPVGLTKAVFFPPDSSTVVGIMKNPEWPSPLAGCPGYTLPVGMPITVQTGADVQVSLESYSIVDEASGRDVEACGFDAGSYPTSWGKRALLSYGAVVLIPRRPLAAGHQYRVAVKTQLDGYTWTFRVLGAEPVHESASNGG